MRKITLSVTLYVALIALFFAMISKASIIGGKVRVEGCFISITLADISGANDFSPVVDVTDCAESRSQVAVNSVYYLKSISTITPSHECTSDVDFCCVLLEPTTDNPSVPTFDLGDGVQQKYQIKSKTSVSILCRP